MAELLFAYGTLKDRLQRDVVLRGATTRALGTGTVAGVLYDLGNYPGLVDGNGRVPGLLIELPDAAALARLDEYEDVDAGLFARRRATVRLDDGGEAEAWVYVYTRPVEGRAQRPSWP